MLTDYGLSTCNKNSLCNPGAPSLRVSRYKIHDDGPDNGDNDIPPTLSNR